MPAARHSVSALAGALLLGGTALALAQTGSRSTWGGPGMGGPPAVNNPNTYNPNASPPATSSTPCVPSYGGGSTLNNAAIVAANAPHPAKGIRDNLHIPSTTSIGSTLNPNEGKKAGC